MPRPKTKPDAPRKARGTGQRAARPRTNMAKNIGNTTQDSIRSGLNAGTVSLQSAMDRSVQQGRELSQQATQNLEAIAKASTVLVRGVQDLAHEMLEVARSGWQRNVDGVGQLAHCHSVQDFVAIQSGLVTDNLHQMTEATRRIAERSLAMANEATQTITAQASTSADRVRRVAGYSSH